MVLYGFGVFCSAVLAEGNEKDVTVYQLVLGANSKKVRTLIFPKEYSLGAVSITDSNSNVVSKIAQGKVVVPAGSIVKFIPAENFYKNPAIIKTLPADGLDSLKCTASSFDDNEKSVCDNALAYVGHLSGLLELNLDRSDATDKGLAYASELPNLQKVSVYEGNMRGASLKRLVTLKQLRYLSLSGNELQEDNLQYLSALPKLEHLYIADCNLGDVGLKYLSKCTGLIRLKLTNNTKITDESVKYILPMKKMRFLDLRGTSITEKELLQFKGLPLVELGVPGKPSKAETDAIAHAFPKTTLLFVKGKSRTVDSDTKSLFAPLHY
jgi:hypothetical protein